MDGLEFWEAGEVAKQRAHAVCERWDLEPDMGQWLILPPRYRGFTTARGTRLKVPERRYPVARYWPGGELPPGVVPIMDGPREQPIERGPVPRSRWLTYSGPARPVPHLTLVPEVTAYDAAAD
jgi:hypothetical protein